MDGLRQRTNNKKTKRGNETEALEEGVLLGLGWSGKPF